MRPRVDQDLRANLRNIIGCDWRDLLRAERQMKFASTQQLLEGKPGKDRVLGEHRCSDVNDRETGPFAAPAPTPNGLFVAATIRRQILRARLFAPPARRSFDRTS